MKAAVLWERRTPIVVEELDLADPASGEARVRILASGVCHSDLIQVRRDTRHVPPLVLGHEAAGVVEAVGPGVSRVRPGDRVIVAFGMHCGECVFCVRGQSCLCATPLPTHVRLRKGDRAVTPLYGVGSFAEAANVDARSLVVIPAQMPVDRAALIACGVATGIGAVINSAGVEPGAHVAVIGVGGVGLNIVQGSRLAGAARIIAVDVLDHKLELAHAFGATHAVNARHTDPVREIRRLTGGWGADYAFEAVGAPETARQAYDAVRKGGMAVIVGVAPGGATLAIDVLDMMASARTVKGCTYGACSRPDRDFARYVELYLSGQIQLDELISRRIALDEVNEALAAMEAGAVARSVIVFT